DVLTLLLLRVVDACRGGVEESLDAGVTGREKHVRADEHAEHARGLVRFDEPHAAHVRGEIVDLVRPLARLAAGSQVIEIELQVFNVVEHLIPLVEGLDVDRSNGEALFTEMAYQPAADEAASAGDDDEIVGHERVSRVERGRAVTRVER